MAGTTGSRVPACRAVGHSPNGRKPVATQGVDTLPRRDPLETESPRSAAGRPGRRGDPRGCRVDSRRGCAPVGATGRDQRGPRRVRRADRGRSAATVASGRRPERRHQRRGARSGAKHAGPTADPAADPAAAEDSANGSGATGSRAGHRPGAHSVGPAGVPRDDRGRGRGDQRRTSGSWLPGIAGRPPARHRRAAAFRRHGQEKEDVAHRRGRQHVHRPHPFRRLPATRRREHRLWTADGGQRGGRLDVLLGAPAQHPELLVHCDRRWIRPTRQLLDAELRPLTTQPVERVPARGGSLRGRPARRAPPAALPGCGRPLRACRGWRSRAP